MKLTPVLTEKSLTQAKKGFYTFWVERTMNKKTIKKEIEDLFNVHVTKIRTMNFKKEIKRNFKGIRQVKPAAKKTIVALKDKEKIDLFEGKAK